MTLDLSNKVALVTGSTSGIGAALAAELARAGAHVMLHGLDTPERLAAARADLAAHVSGKVEGHGADLCDPDQITALMAHCEATLGPVDILVNNAGIQHVAPLEAFSPAKWDQVLALNLSAAFHTTRLALPHMKAQGWGRIINLASAHGLRASPYKAAYVAAKHGLIGLTKTTALEGAEAGITCNAICPGYVRTPLVEAQIPDAAAANNMSHEEVVKKVMLDRQPTREFVGVDEIAGLTLYLCSQEARNMTGAALSLDGGWTAR